MSDIDSIADYKTVKEGPMIEYDRHNPVMLAEIKFGNPGYILDCRAKDVAQEIKNLNWCASDRVPTFLVVYSAWDLDGRLMQPDQADPSCSQLGHIQFTVLGVNDKGKAIFPNPTLLTEAEWLDVILTIRNEDYDPQCKLFRSWKECPIVIMNYE